MFCDDIINEVLVVFKSKNFSPSRLWQVRQNGDKEDAMSTGLIIFLAALLVVSVVATVFVAIVLVIIIRDFVANVEHYFSCDWLRSQEGLRVITPREMRGMVISNRGARAVAWAIFVVWRFLKGKR